MSIIWYFSFFTWRNLHYFCKSHTCNFQKSRVMHISHPQRLKSNELMLKHDFQWSNFRHIHASIEWMFLVATYPKIPSKELVWLLQLDLLRHLRILFLCLLDYRILSSINILVTYFIGEVSKVFSLPIRLSNVKEIAYFLGVLDIYSFLLPFLFHLYRYPSF